MRADLHSLSLYDTEDVSLCGGSDVKPDTCQQAAQRAASWEVRASPDVQPPTKHLERTENITAGMIPQISHSMCFITYKISGIDLELQMDDL